MRTISSHGLRVLAGYTLAILVGLTLLEVFARTRGADQRLWYPVAIRDSGGRPLRTVFVGSSRVQAAIDIAAVRATLPPSDRLDINLGQGFSTVVEHSLGIRELADKGLLSGATVFIEAPGGIPDDSRWTDRWFYLERPDFLMTVVRNGDLPRIWRTNQTREEKFTATVRGLLRWSEIFTSHELMRVAFLTDVDHRARDLSSRLASAQNGATQNGASGEAPATADLRAEGGVRSDLSDRDRIRLEAVKEGERMLNEQRLIADWSDRVVATTVAIVRNAGGHVVFFETPLSAPMRIASETPMGVENRRLFREQVDRWGMRLISLAHNYPDDQFPDVWHLSASASTGFTKDVLARW